MNTLNLERKSNYVILRIDNGKVNAINSELVKELTQTFDELNKDATVKGVILAGRPHCFSAGLDIVSLAQYTPEEGKQFWRYYLGAVQSMVRFSKPFVCAITGYAPAGATILALCADYRVMGKGTKHVIGMHEFKMSLQIPELLMAIYAYHLGEKKAWRAVQKAQLFNSDEALELDLVDESVEVEKVVERAEKQLKRLMQVYAPVFQKSKKRFRKGLLKLVDQEIEPMVEVIAKGFEDPMFQQMTQLFVASLKK